MNSFIDGNGGLAKLTLTNRSGARAEIYRHGAHVTSWIPPDGHERLLLSKNSLYRAGSAIRGGVPICFPQFSGFGPLPKHGFARTTDWELVASDQSQAQFKLQNSEATRQVWSHPFEARFTVALMNSSLALTLSVTNTGSQPFSFTTALHTYLKVSDVHTVQVGDLHGVHYFDQVTNQTDQVETNSPLTITGEIDRIYYQAPRQLTVRTSPYQTTLTTENFPDVVIWNPWSQKGATLADLEPEGYRHMLCIEAAVVGQPIALAPQQSWRGTQTLHA
jgi:glucose-6-phosphate 1-epimerase